VTFNRDHISTNYLMLSKMIRDLRFNRLNYDKESEIRNEIELAIEVLEKLKKSLGDIIDARK